MLVLGRYALGDEIARGGIASVHLGLVLGDAGFTRPVAIKRLLPAMVHDPELAAAFLDEARLASRVRHPNVVSTLDVREQDGELFLVLEYVHGESLAGLVAAARASREGPIPMPIVSAIVAGALRGLNAAHEARDEFGQALGIVHRDVTPHNIIVGADGVARVIDFGIAKAASRAQITREGQVKGKLGYLAPEQLGQRAVRATDIYGAGVCLWEALTNERAFDGSSESAILAKVMSGMVSRPSKVCPAVSPELDRVVLRALDRDPEKRFATGGEMAAALESVVVPASPAEVGAFVERVAASKLREREARIAKLVVERDASSSRAAPPESAVAGPPVTNEIAPVSEIALGPARPQRRAWWVALASAVLMAIAAFWIAVRGPGTATNETPASVSANVDPAASVATAMLTAEPVVAISDRPAPTVDEEAPLAATAEPTSRAAPARAPVAAHRGRGASSKVKCDPPYSIDRDGVRRYKKECLE